MGNVSERNDSSEIVLRKSLSSETFLRNRVVSKCFDEKTFCEKKNTSRDLSFWTMVCLETFCREMVFKRNARYSKKGGNFWFLHWGLSRTFLTIFKRFKHNFN